MKRHVKSPVDAGRRPERHGHPAGLVERRSTREGAHLVGRQRPDRLAARDRPSEGHVGIEAESAPRLESVLRVARVRDHLHRGPSGARENDEAGLRADEPQRVLQAGVADVATSRRQGEGGGDLLEPLGLLRSRCSLLFRQAPFELLEREARLIREPADDGDRGRIGPIDHRLPRHDEHQLRAAADDDRRTERRADAQLAHAFEADVARFARDIRDERDAQPRDRVLQAREVCERHAKSQRPLRLTRIAVQELEVVAADSPQHSVVGAERHARLATDGLGHLRRGLGVEPWSDLQDALERPARLPLALVQSRSLECLLCEPRRRRGDRKQLVVEGILAVEEELDGADRLAGRPDRHGHCRAYDGWEYCGALGEVGLEGRSVVGSDGSTLPKCDREQRRLLEREPATWNLGLLGDPDRVDDEDVVALEQAERSALRAEDLRRTLCERTRDLDGGDGSRELAAERLQRLGALERALDLDGDVGRTLPPDPQHACDDDDERPDREVHRPPGHVFRAPDVELSIAARRATRTRASTRRRATSRPDRLRPTTR